MAITQLIDTGFHLVDTVTTQLLDHCISQYDGQHRFGNGHGTGHRAKITTFVLGDSSNSRAQVNRCTWIEGGTYGLLRQTTDQWGAGGDATLDPTRSIGVTVQTTRGVTKYLIVNCGASTACVVERRTKLYALDRLNAQHRHRDSRRRRPVAAAAR